MMPSNLKFKLDEAGGIRINSEHQQPDELQEALAEQVRPSRQ